MNAQHEPDAIIAAWLDEGPSELPEQTRRAIAVTTRTTDQKRRSPWAPWRTTLMPSFLRVAVAAIAVIAVAGGAVYVLRPGQGVGVASPAPAASASSAPPSPEARASASLDWTTYASSRFAYTIDYPADWGITPATSDWPSIGFPEDASFDNLGPRPFGTQVVLSSVALTGGKDATEWTTELDQLNAGLCTQVSDRHNITLDGVVARQEELDCIQTYHVIEVAAVGEGRYFLIRLYSAGPPLTAADRSIFDLILASFRFGAPGSDPSSATVTVDQSKEAGYTIAIPSSWRSRTYPNGIFISAAAPITTGAMWFSAATGGEHVIDVGVAYGGSPYDIRGQTVDELLASVDSVYRAQTSSEGTNEHEVTIDGEPAWVTEHEVGGPPTLWIDAVVIHGDRAYNLSLDAPVENAAELRAAFDEVMASIRWTD